MSNTEGPNPERRSTGALVCFCAGAVLTTLAWFLGVGGVMTTAMSGGDPALMAGGLFMLIALALSTLLGIALMAIGGVWMVLRVVADQTGEASEKRYRNVER